jgi:UDP-glucose 4-epimerase
VRDYIHVVDLAVGHVAAVRRLTERPGVLTVNLGTGRGYSVIEVVKAFEKASGRPVPYEIVARRPGDVAQCYAEPGPPSVSWLARQRASTRCAPTPGAGRAPTRRVTPIERRSSPQ